jgi:hypothetical protein
MLLKNILIAIMNMVWDIFWPLALGFILSAIIRTYISTSTISSRLGKSNAKGLALSTFFGAISSSCSYAAASMARTLIFQWAGWMPQSHGVEMSIQMEGIRWNYKTVLNLIFIPLSVIGFFIGKKTM